MDGIAFDLKGNFLLVMRARVISYNTRVIASLLTDNWVVTCHQNKTRGISILVDVAF